MRNVVCAEILSNDEQFGIFSMWLKVPDMDVKCGQFVNVYLNSESKLLPRPISVCEIQKNKIRLVYQAVGGGTKELSTYKVGEQVEILGGLGNGFTLEQKQNFALVGGGIGIPPLIELAKELRKSNPIAKITAYLGGRSASFIEYLAGDFENLGVTVIIATDDGSLGYKGNVVERLKENSGNYDVIYSCGPRPMLVALSQFAEQENIKTYVSMEERMACGIGACVGCVVKIKTGDGFINKKVCKDGPVFESKEVMWE